MVLAEMTPQLQATLAKLPTKPGVYLLKDDRGRVLYVGKAQSLRARVRQYWQQGRSAPPLRIESAMDRVADVAEFLEAVRQVAAGGTVLDPEVVAQLLTRRRRDDHLRGFRRVFQAFPNPRLEVLQDFPAAFFLLEGKLLRAHRFFSCDKASNKN